MARTIGTPKTGGRKSGTPNKATAVIKSLAQPYGETAVAVLNEIMTDAGMPPAARVSAAKELLDRGYGKSIQGIELTGEGGAPIETKTTVVDEKAVKAAVAKLSGGY